MAGNVRHYWPPVLTGPPDANGNGPTPRFVGDLWWDTTNRRLNLHDGVVWQVAWQLFSGAS